MILAKTHVANGRKIVAACDSELLGKKFEEKNLQIDLTGGCQEPPVRDGWNVEY